MEYEIKELAQTCYLAAYKWVHKTLIYSLRDDDFFWHFLIPIVSNLEVVNTVCS